MKKKQLINHLNQVRDGALLLKILSYDKVEKAFSAGVAEGINICINKIKDHGNL